MEEKNKNMQLYNLGREVPEEAKKEIKGGRMKGMTNINAMWRIKRLTEMFGACGVGWYYKTVNQWMEKAEQEVAAFVDIELYVKVDGDWSAPIYGTGGSKFAAKEKDGIYVSDECYKMATTDALSVACKQLGIGADVYFAEDKNKYDVEVPAEIEQITAIDYMAAELNVNLPKLYQKYGMSRENVTERIAKKIFLSLLNEKRKRDVSAHTNGDPESPANRAGDGSDNTHTRPATAGNADRKENPAGRNKV